MFEVWAKKQFYEKCYNFKTYEDFLFKNQYDKQNWYANSVKFSSFYLLNRVRNNPSNSVVAGSGRAGPVYHCYRL